MSFPPYFIFRPNNGNGSIQLPALRPSSTHKDNFMDQFQVEPLIIQQHQQDQFQTEPLIIHRRQPYQFQADPLINQQHQQDQFQDEPSILQQYQRDQFQGEPLINQQDQFQGDPIMQQNQEEETENENSLDYLATGSFSAIQMHIIDSRIQGVPYSRIIWNGKNLYNRQISKCLKHSALGFK